MITKKQPIMNSMTPSNQLRKTHPMVLISATALTILSILGSAAMTGLIPNVYSERTDQVTNQSVTNQLISNKSMPQKVPEQSNSSFSDQPKLQHKNTYQDKSEPDNQTSCNNCGRIYSIKTVKLDGEASGSGAVAGGVAGSVIGNQICREDGAAVGEQVKLKSGQLISA
jgi:hypothetical protein